MASHALAFLNVLGLMTCDVLGFSLGGMVAQQIALDQPGAFRRMILVGTAPRGGEDIMHLEKPGLARHLADPTLKGYALLAERESAECMLLTYPDSGHGSLFQFHESFTRQAAAFLASDSPFAPY